jgi:hypothetical protein
MRPGQPGPGEPPDRRAALTGRSSIANSINHDFSGRLTYTRELSRQEGHPRKNAIRTLNPGRPLYPITSASVTK